MGSSPIARPTKGFVHATAIIEPGATLGDNVYIGPYCLIGANVELGNEVYLHSHVVIVGFTSIGDNCQFFPFSSIGHAPQDLKYDGEASRLLIGSHCTIREGVTINPGTSAGGMLTQLGSRVLVMANAHIAHDCTIGNDVILANNVMLAGHCQVGDFAAMGGGSAAHQFVRIGAYAMVGGLSGIGNDVIPFGLAVGPRALLNGLNLVGLKRRGFSREVIFELRKAFRLLFSGESTLVERLEIVAREFAGRPEVEKVVAFIREGGDRDIMIPRRGREIFEQ